MKLAGVEYVGLPGISRDCLYAVLRMLQFNDEEFRILDYTNEGFQRAIKAGGGKITYSTFLVSELGPNLEAKVAGELLKNPDVNVVKSPYTGATLLGIASGIQKAGRQGKVSRIVARLPAGARVTTPRFIADYVVTEWGTASLRGHSDAGRARELCRVSHPAFRESLEREAATS